MIQKRNAPGRWHGARAANKAYKRPDFTPGALLKKLERAAWIAAYSAEEARQRYADRRQLFRQAGACIVLAVLRLAGGRHV